jgi:hypothetical protein
MGLLDDAIREHLDLKRRRGGDPTEIARAEQEALGPVRRDPGPGSAGEAAAPAVHEPHEHAEPHEHEAHHDEPGGEHHAAESAAPERREMPEAPEPADERDDPQAAHTHHDDPVLQPTTEYHVEEHHRPEQEHAADETHEEHPKGDTPDDPHAAHPEPGAPDDDVLEETPDFLQETPEHDRLWFEQRPPRDFDFDG